MERVPYKGAMRYSRAFIPTVKEVPKEAITRLADVLGFRYTYDFKSGEYYHPAMLAFVSPQGLITRYSLAVAFEPDDMKKALVEAGEGTVGTAVDQFILWCFNYDPNSNGK